MSRDLRRYFVEQNLHLITVALVDSILVSEWVQFSDALSIPRRSVINLRRDFDFNIFSPYALISDTLWIWISAGESASRKVHHLVEVLRRMDKISLAEQLKELEYTNGTTNIIPDFDTDDPLEVQIRDDLNYIHAHFDLRIRDEFMTQFYHRFKPINDTKVQEIYEQEILDFCSYIAPIYTPLEQQTHREELSESWMTNKFIMRMLNTSVDYLKLANKVDVDGNWVIKCDLTDLSHFNTFLVHVNRDYLYGITKKNRVSYLKALYNTKRAEIEVLLVSSEII